MRRALLLLSSHEGCADPFLTEGTEVHGENEIPLCGLSDLRERNFFQIRVEKEGKIRKKRLAKRQSPTQNRGKDAQQARETRMPPAPPQPSGGQINWSSCPNGLNNVLASG